VMRRTAPKADFGLTWDRPPESKRVFLWGKMAAEGSGCVGPPHAE
jgi:hypothetical protein